jgi:hypothetical protein
MAFVLDARADASPINACPNEVIGFCVPFYDMLHGRYVLERCVPIPNINTKTTAPLRSGHAAHYEAHSAHGCDAMYASDYIKA